MFRGELLHHTHRRSIRHSLCHFIPSRILLGAKIRAVEKLLQTENLRFFLRGLFDQFQVLVDHRLSDLGQRTFGAELVLSLYQGTAHNSRHEMRPPRNATIAEIFNRTMPARRASFTSFTCRKCPNAQPCRTMQDGVRRAQKPLPCCRPFECRCFREVRAFRCAHCYAFWPASAFQSRYSFESGLGETGSREHQRRRA